MYLECYVPKNGDMIEGSKVMGNHGFTRLRMEKIYICLQRRE